MADWFKLQNSYRVSLSAFKVIRKKLAKITRQPRCIKLMAVLRSNINSQPVKTEDYFDILKNFLMMPQLYVGIFFYFHADWLKQNFVF